MPKPVRPLLGESAESRVATRRRALMDHAFVLMADDQWRRVSIGGLCRDVGLNKRYFYESFETLDALEDAVLDELMSGLIRLGTGSALSADEEGLDTEGLARKVLGDCLVWLVDDPRRARVLFAKASDNPRARAQRNMVVRNLAHALAVFGLAYHGPRQPTVARTEAQDHLAGLAASMLIGGTIESVLRWLDGEITMPLEAFTVHIARFWVELAATAVDIAVEQAP